MKKKSLTKKRASRPGRSPADSRRSESAVFKPTRTIPSKVSLYLYVRAGGRCEFDGCNDYLLEHPTTSAVGNFAEKAHIYGFKEGAARGLTVGRPADVHDLSNLILLCARCHHLIDEVAPEKYPVEVLKKFKADHEDRIFRLTGIAKDRDTIPFVLKTQIAGRTSEISDAEMQSAAAPNYIRLRDKIEVDISSVPDGPNQAFLAGACAAIDQKIDALRRVPVGKSGALRVSVFALAPIPLLAYLGSRLSDKWTVDLYQRRRVGNEPWVWQEGEGSAEFETKRLAAGPSGAGVGLLVNVSGRNEPALLTTQREGCTVYELSVKDQEPSSVILKTRADLERFRSEYMRALATIRANHPTETELHVLAAAPAPIAILLGLMRLPKVDPALLVYDRDCRMDALSSPLMIG